MTDIIRPLVLLFLLTAIAYPQQPTQPAQTGIDQANAALAAGDYPSALKLLTTLNAQTPKDSEILYDLGMTIEALHPTDSANPEAEADYRAAINANPLRPLPHIALGLMLARSHRAAEAHEELTTAAQIPEIPAPLKARALRALARLDMNEGKPSAASGELLEALQLTPETADDTLLAAEIAEATPDLPAAEQAYRRILSATPNDPDATAALARVLIAQHRSAEAESLLRDALAAHPDDPTLTSRLASTLLASADPEKRAQATPLLEKLHAAHPQDANIARLLARVYAQTNHPDQADALYTALIASEGASADPTLLDDRATLLLQLHRPAEAEKLLRQAVANPAAFPGKDEFGDATLHLAFAASEIDDPRMVLQALQLRATVLPPSPVSLFLEATAQDALHQSAQAADLYKRFLAEAHGTLPEQESKARERLAAMGIRKVNPGH